MVGSKVKTAYDVLAFGTFYDLSGSLTQEKVLIIL